jgi:hypothetical protein
MTLDDVFNGLVDGELKNLRLSDDGYLPVKEYNRFITLINLGLTELYTRFNLKQKSKSIVRMEGVDTYSFDVDGDVLELLEVYDVYGEAIPINRYPSRGCVDNAVYTPDMKSLIIGSGVVNNDLTLVYQANHPKIARVGVVNLATFNPASVPIELPIAFLDALLYYVAHKVFTPMDLQSLPNKAPFHAGNNYMQKFEAACARLKNTGLDVSDGYMEDKFYERGFV